MLIDQVNSNLSYKKIFLISPENSFGISSLYKEHGELPYYFSKINPNYVVIADGISDINSEQDYFRTIYLRKPKSMKLWNIRRVITVLKYARKIDILFLSCITPNSFIKMLAYKLGGGQR